MIDNLDIERVSLLPYEADAILVIDSNAVLSETIAFQSFQFVTARCRKVAQPPRRVQCFQFPPRWPLDMPQCPYIVLFEQSFCTEIAKALDHRAKYISLCGYRETANASQKMLRVADGWRLSTCKSI